FRDEPGSTVPLFGGVFAGSLTAYLMANLAGNRKIANASDTDKRTALARTPPAGKALVFLYREGFVAKLAGMNLGIDGHAVPQLKSPRFTCVVVSAGKPTLKASFGGLAGPQNRTTELEITAAPDSVIAARFTVGLGVVQNKPAITVMPDTAAVLQTLA